MDHVLELIIPTLEILKIEVFIFPESWKSWKTHVSNFYDPGNVGHFFFILSTILELYGRLSVVIFSYPGNSWTVDFSYVLISWKY